MITRRPRLGPVRRHGGFTLVELLVTIVVMAILMGLVFAAVRAAQHSARVAKTKATIGKLNQIIMGKYDSYRARRVALDIHAFAESKYSATEAQSPKTLARIRVNAIRDLMRMEMPDRWSDINLTPLIYVPNSTPAVPALTQHYSMLYKKAENNRVQDLSKYSSAKLLYMMVMADPEASRHFHTDEYGVVDQSGMPVFLDGWNHPIFFLRWPVGFVAQYKGDSDLQSGDATKDHDPFDPQNTFPTHWACYPLIYSAGADGRSDINVGTDGSSNEQPYRLNGSGNLDPYEKDKTSHYIGEPLPSVGFDGASVQSTDPLGHYDNIHNHRIEAK